MYRLTLLLLLIQHTLCALLSPRNSVAPSVIKPYVSVDEIKHHEWSNASTVIRQRGQTLTYSNFTIRQTRLHGHYAHPRWLARETAATTTHIKDRRGLIVDKPLGQWSAANTGRVHDGPLWIFFCWTTNGAKNVLETAMVAAMQRWNDALGCNKGIGLYSRIENCPASGRLPHVPHARLVSIILDMDMQYGGAATLGAPTPQSHAEMRLPPEQGNYPLPSGYTYTDMLVHELGHVLGLDHEHARVDGPQYGLEIDCVRIPGYVDMVAAINSPRGKTPWPAGSIHHGHDITVADMCKYGELSGPHEELEFGEIWFGGAILPKTYDPVTGLNALGQRGSCREHGPFDWDSVMLYETAATHAHFRVVNGQRQPIPEPRPGIPSAGDIAAVKALYPDIAAAGTDLPPSNDFVSVPG